MGNKNGYNRAHHIGEVVFEVVRGGQGLVSAGDPCNAPGSESLPERVEHALIPIPIPILFTIRSEVIFKYVGICSRRCKKTVQN